MPHVRASLAFSIRIAVAERALHLRITHRRNILTSIEPQCVNRYPTNGDGGPQIFHPYCFQQRVRWDREANATTPIVNCGKASYGSVRGPTLQRKFGDQVIMADSGQKFIKRNRPPRVQIQYENPHNAEKLVELPFVMGIMSDLSGNASEVEKAPIAERKFLEIDMDNFDNRMKAIKPGVSMQVQNKLGDAKDEKMGVKLNFEKMTDFNPAQVVRQVPALAKLLKAREQLANLQRYMDGKVAAEDQIKNLLKDPELMKLLKEKAEGAGTDEKEKS